MLGIHEAITNLFIGLKVTQVTPSIKVSKQNWYRELVLVKVAILQITVVKVCLSKCIG